VTTFPDITTETVPVDVELDLAENEPPGLLPTDQTSYWGVLRAVFAAEIQVLADQMAQWYLNLDPRTVDEDDMPEWEYEVGLPVNPAGRGLEQRRSAVISRRWRGPFTRTRRAQVVESFIGVVLGIPPLIFTEDGLIFTDDGLEFGTDAVGDLETLYAIVEDIPDFSYIVYILDDVDEDTDGLVRELTRITPSGITFTVEHVSELPDVPRTFGDRKFGDGTFGSPPDSGEFGGDGMFGDGGYEFGPDS
jgi:hypothetical protein